MKKIDKLDQNIHTRLEETLVNRVNEIILNQRAIIEYLKLDIDYKIEEMKKD